MKKLLLTILSSACLSISLQAQIAQPTNANFENWQTYNGSIGNTYMEPVDWNTGNECSELINQLAVTQSSDAYSGTYSARLETLPAFGNIKVNGVITTASMICSANSGGQEGGTAYTAMIPDSIVGFFKYAPSTNDSAYSQIMFLANNDMDTISFTRINFSETVNEWTRFSAPITPAGSGQTPEKLSLFFNSSWGDGAQGEAVVGSVFHIDSVHFIAVPAGIKETYNNADWSVYPNPATDILNVKSVTRKAANIEILDVTGKQVKHATVGAGSATVDLSGFVPGMYLYQIKTLEQQVVRTGKLLVNP
ncbi:MAG: T9SS type A sorting domain-containing protein [Flavobacteriales bacterium]|nr:T9SS type A sorting domain-containing protein [Flavobacteriales bacterium]